MMNVLVIGDSCIDVFSYGTCKRICPEAPVPVFNPVTESRNFGMAGNVSENLKSLGAAVDLVTNHEVVIKKRIVDQKSNQMIVRVDENDRVENSFKIDSIEFSKYDSVVVADYDKGYLSWSDIMKISERHQLCFLDTKKVLGIWAEGYKFIKINEHEWDRCKDAGLSYEKWADRLIVTLSERGAMYNNEVIGIESPGEVKDISGAGDTFLAAFVFSYLRTHNTRESILFANECASKVVKKRGVSVI